MKCFEKQKCNFYTYIYSKHIYSQAFCSCSSRLLLLLYIYFSDFVGRNFWCLFHVSLDVCSFEQNSVCISSSLHKLEFSDFFSSSHTHLHFRLEEAGIMNRLPHFFVSRQKGDGEEVMI